MERAELKELGYIVPIATVPSILAHGILSHKRARRVPHTSIALEAVQDRRAEVVVPNGRPLHEYANLYICPRNPMLLRRSSMIDEICVLRVQTDVVDIPNTVITSSNAASRYTLFKPAPEGLGVVDRDRTFADWWNHPEDQIEHWRHSAQKCAEVLVPDEVPPGYIFGASVGNDAAFRSLQSLTPGLETETDAHMFFRSRR